MSELTVLQPIERTLKVHAVPCDPIEPGGPELVLVVQDVTELYRYERLRKEFVANVSHELKSPLTAIRGLTETLREGALQDPAHGQQFLGLIEQETARLSRLIDDLLELAQLESGQGPRPTQRVELGALIDEMLPALQAKARPRQITIEAHLDRSWQVGVDADWLRRILRNLLDNAVAYNREGGTVTVTVQPESGWARVAVADTGLGIPAEDLPRVFERFYRVDKARSRESGGTGLGLAIVKHAVESYGGAVAVESQLGRGSTFTFTIPLAS